MPNDKTFYITTTLPYVNAKPHLGHALEFVRADVVARWKRLSGYEVFFNTGTDEHGQKLLLAAEKAGMPVQAFVDEAAASFRTILPLLGISDDIHFVRTTDPHHEKAAQEFWRRVAKATDREGRPLIYKKAYRSKYCVGCEETKTESELVDGRCPIHPQLELEIIEEENYFFRFSSMGEKLIELYDSGAFRTIPESRANEMRAFIGRGLEDFSISRLRSKMSWGVPVPGDDAHVMYVWFDALTNYISTLGWPESEGDPVGDYERFWVRGTPTQYCGKDNTRFQSAMWQAMLLAAGLPSSHTVVVNGFVTGEGGVKMSKSLGNVVDPADVVGEFGTEALRYFVCREIGSFEDSPFTIERFKQAYNTALANGLGNLVSRVMKLCTTYSIKGSFRTDKEILDMSSPYRDALERFDIQAAANHIWGFIQSADRKIQESQPFKLLKSDSQADKDRGVQVMIGLLHDIYSIAVLLRPIMPETANVIERLVRTNKMPESPLFRRID